MDKYRQAQDIITQLASKAKKSNNIYDKEETPQSNKGFVVKRKLFVVLTDIDKNLEKSLKELQGLKRYGIDFYIVLSRNIDDLIDIDVLKQYIKPLGIFTQKDLLEIDNISIKGEGAIIPLASQGTVARLALGIQDDVAIAFIWKLLWRNMPVMMDMGKITVEGKYSAGALVLKEIVEDYIKRLYEMGIEDVSNESYLAKILGLFNKGNNDLIFKGQSRFKDERLIDIRVLTEKDLLNMDIASGEIIVPKKTIITPLANDKAKGLGIKIIRK